MSVAQGTAEHGRFGQLLELPSLRFDLLTNHLWFLSLALYSVHRPSKIVQHTQWKIKHWSLCQTTNWSFSQQEKITRHSAWPLLPDVHWPISFISCLKAYTNLLRSSIEENQARPLFSSFAITLMSYCRLPHYRASQIDRSGVDDPKTVHQSKSIDHPRHLCYYKHWKPCHWSQPCSMQQTMQFASTVFAVTWQGEVFRCAE